MWEYKRNDYKIKTYGELIEILNTEGIENWEVIYYHEEKPVRYGNLFQIIVLFKRLKQDPACINNNNDQKRIL